MNLKIVLGGVAAAASAVVLTSVAIAQSSNDQGPLGSTVGHTGGSNPSNAPATSPDQSMSNQGMSSQGMSSQPYGSHYRGYTSGAAPNENAGEQPGAPPSGGMAGERG